MPSKKLWAYISKLEKVIKSTMESNEEIAELVSKIQDEGIEVALNCIALFSDPKGKTFAGPMAEGAMNQANAAAVAAAAAAAAAAKAKGRKRRGKKVDDPAEAALEAEGATEAPPEKGAKRKRKKPEAAAQAKGAKGEQPEFRVTDKDREFLKEMGIRFD